MMILVPDGPLLKKGIKFNIKMIGDIYKEWDYTQASLGYFGHMWEQYSFWAFLPLMIESYATVHGVSRVNVSLATFFVIASGAVGSLVTGWATKHFTNSFAAVFNIGSSGLCGLIHPIFYGYPSFGLYICLLVYWGWTVVSDSAQFSALASRSCKPELVGTGLTIYNCLGYAMTIISIQLCQAVDQWVTMQFVSMVIAIGPVAGAIIIWSRAYRDGIWLPFGGQAQPAAIVNPAKVSLEEMKPTVAQFEIGGEDQEIGKPVEAVIGKPVEELIPV